MKLSRARLSSQVYSILKEMIANYRFKPGVHVNIEELSRELDISRTPVWEAVHRLVQEGLLKNVPNKGVFIVELTPEAALDLYTVREVLEGLAARLAVQNINDRSLKALEKSLAKQHQIIQEKNLVDYSRLDFDFHSTIYELSNNKVLGEMLEAIKNKMHSIAIHIKPILPSLYDDHCEILEAMKSGDPDKAEKAFMNHNKRLIKQIKESSQNNKWIKRNGTFTNDSENTLHVIDI